MGTEELGTLLLLYFYFIFDNLNWTLENLFFYFCQTGSKLLFINEPPSSIGLT